MRPLIIAKIVLALAGLGVFAYGVHPDDPPLRWVGIGLVAVSFLLRFVKDHPPSDGAP